MKYWRRKKKTSIPQARTEPRPFNWIELETRKLKRRCWARHPTYLIIPPSHPRKELNYEVISSLRRLLTPITHTASFCYRLRITSMCHHPMLQFSKRRSKLRFFNWTLKIAMHISAAFHESSENCLRSSVVVLPSGFCHIRYFSCAFFTAQIKLRKMLMRTCVNVRAYGTWSEGILADFNPSAITFNTRVIEVQWHVD